SAGPGRLPAVRQPARLPAGRGGARPCRGPLPPGGPGGGPAWGYGGGGDPPTGGSASRPHPAHRDRRGRAAHTAGQVAAAATAVIRGNAAIAATSWASATAA